MDKLNKVKSFLKQNMKDSTKEFLKERIVNRKAMFIPIAAVASFMLVGYAAADSEPPVIVSSHIEIPYGEQFDIDMVNVEDNRDDRSELHVEADTSSLNTNQLGDYKVSILAVDSFNNEAQKEITVTVIDDVAPTFEMVGVEEGYALEIPVKGSSDLSSYIKAIDNVDGDVTAFIEADTTLNTNTLSTQIIHLSVSDVSGNTAKKTIEFVVTDTEAPEIKFKKGKDAVLNYGSSFNLSDYIVVTDNYDDNVKPVVEGSIDNKKEDGVQTLKITATDSSNNKTVETLNIRVKDTQAPTISLKKTSVSINKGESLNLAAYLSSATDNKDGDITSKVSIPSISTKKAGTFTATYKVSDAAGNTATRSIKVTIKEVYTASSRGNYYGNSVVGAAYSRLGCPYKWGAAGSNSFDCSGLVQWCYAKAGKSLPHSSSALRSSGTKVSVSSAQPGDILWKPGHVGIYIGGGKYIHAPSSGDVVKISTDTYRYSYAIRP